jgi:hypothetical protein
MREGRLNVLEEGTPSIQRMVTALVERSQNSLAILSVRAGREILMNMKCYKDLSVWLK